MKKGYTLLETTIYISLVAVVIVIALGSVITMYQAYGKTKIERSITTNGEVALERIIREIRSATSTDAASVFGTNPGTLALSTGIVFSLAGGILSVSEGSSPAQNLTSDGVTISNLTFYKDSASNSALIKIYITVESGAGKFFKSRVFSGSAVMRKAY